MVRHWPLVASWGNECFMWVIFPLVGNLCLVNCTRITDFKRRAVPFGADTLCRSAAEGQHAAGSPGLRLLQLKSCSDASSGGRCGHGEQLRSSIASPAHERYKNMVGLNLNPGNLRQPYRRPGPATPRLKTRIITLLHSSRCEQSNDNQHYLQFCSCFVSVRKPTPAELRALLSSNTILS